MVKGISRLGGVNQRHKELGHDGKATLRRVCKESGKAVELCASWGTGVLPMQLLI